MCGIVGAVATGEELVDPDEIERLRDVLAHRGPDGSGVWLSTDHRVGLAHRRLAIIDTSTAARQPMTSDDGSAVITYNGEIYNYRELRLELAAEGDSFRTQSDTEIILRAYQRWGE